MKRLGDINPTVRGLFIVALIALVVVVLDLYTTLAVVYGLLQIAFFIGIAFFIYMVWRERRGEIEMWSQRARWVFYGAAGLILVDLALFFTPFRHVQFRGFAAFSFVAVLAICGFSMWRVWRDEHTYGL